MRPIRSIYIQRLGLELPTPALLLHTKGASVPHITREVLEMITKEKYIFQIPLLTTSQMQKGIEVQGKGIGEFAGISDFPTMMTFQDPSVSVPQSPMEKYIMPLWTRMGKKLYDAKMYMDTVEINKPDIYEVLSDSCLNKDSSKKRMSKSADRSIVMFDECLERHKNTDLKNHSLIYAVIGGGHCMRQRETLTNHVLKNIEDINGFVLDGFDCDYPNLENVQYDSIKTLVETVIAKLPKDKPCMVYGCWNAVTLIDLVSAGCDLFDSSMPYTVTERGSALIFSLDISKNIEESVEACDQYEIDLNNKKYVEDFNPIVNNCACLTCQKYTKAYINHLLNTKEMLAGVLLMIHNLHHYMEFFKIIRKCIKSDDLNILRKLIDCQYKTQTSKAEKSKTSDEPVKKSKRNL